MFKVNKLTDYATVVMVDLVSADLARPSQKIANNTGIPYPTVNKLMKDLLHAGLVRSHRGINGGYSLASPANKITIADIIQAVEGPIALTSCVNNSLDKCTYEDFCAVQGRWNRVNKAVVTALKKVTVADMT
tara:strand:- start:408 stop:803 length:396 start_codon:yes stop_codon:yes gene_type:complete